MDQKWQCIGAVIILSLFTIESQTLTLLNFQKYIKVLQMAVLKKYRSYRSCILQSNQLLRYRFTIDWIIFS